MFKGRRKNNKLKILIAALAVCLLAAILAALVLAGCTKKDERKPAAGTTTTSSETTTVPTASSTDDTTTTVPASPTVSPTAEIPNDIPPYGWSLDSVNVRKTPNTWYEAIGGLKQGEKVTIIGRETDSNGGHWYKIKWKDGEAYVKAEFISPTEVVPIETTAAADSATTTAGVSE